MGAPGRMRPGPAGAAQAASPSRDSTGASENLLSWGWGERAHTGDNSDKSIGFKEISMCSHLYR